LMWHTLFHIGAKRTSTETRATLLRIA